MPDLKSELEKVIHAWEQPQLDMEPEIKMETTTPTQPAAPATPTYTQVLFEHIKANPGRTTLELEHDLPQIHPQSISSLLSSMLKRHLLRKVGGQGKRQFGGTYEVAADVYMSPSEQLGLGRGRRLSTKAKRKNRPVLAAVKNLPAVVEAQSVAPAPVVMPAPAPVVAAPVVAPVVNVNDIDLESLTIGQARALRDKLNALFGA